MTQFHRSSFTPLTDRGYTVFTVVHGSQPRYTVPEIIQDMNRAVRFIRYHAKITDINPDQHRRLRSLSRRSFVADVRYRWG